MMASGLISTGQPAFQATAAAATQPAAAPRMPPAIASATASAKNCRRISQRRAPSAIRNPISRVRSLTCISIMFMMLMPPTISDTATTEVNK